MRRLYSLKFLTIEKLYDRFGNYAEYKNTIGDKYEGIGLSIEMQKRANFFKEKVLPECNLERLPEILRNTFETLLTTAVDTDRKAGSNLIGISLGPIVLGQVAAAALRPNFQVFDVIDSSLTKTEQANAVDSPSLEVIAQFTIDEQGEKSNAKFTFQKGGQSSQWLLTGFYADL